MKYDFIHVSALNWLDQYHIWRGKRPSQKPREVMRGLKNTNSLILRGMQVYHNFVRLHMGLNGKTPAEAARIIVEGENKWLILIRTLISQTRMNENSTANKYLSTF